MKYTQRKVSEESQDFKSNGTRDGNFQMNCNRTINRLIEPRHLLIYISQTLTEIFYLPKYLSERHQDHLVHECEVRLSFSIKLPFNDRLLLQFLDACEKFGIVNVERSQNTYVGALVLRQPLDYRERPFYQLLLRASVSICEEKKDSQDSILIMRGF